MTTYNGPRQLREQKDFDRLTAELVRAQPPTKRSVIRWREDVPVPLDSIVIVFTPVAGGSLVLPRPESRDDGRTVIVAVAEGSGPLTVECPRPEEAAERKELVQPGAYTFYAIDRVYYVDTAIVGSVPAEAVAAALEADGTSVLGKFDAGTGDVAPIVAAADNVVLARESGTVGFTQVNTNMILDDAVTYAKMSDIAARSVMGNSNSSAGQPGSITAGSDETVLLRRSGLLTFGLIHTSCLFWPTDSITAGYVLGGDNGTTFFFRFGYGGSSSVDVIDGFLDVATSGITANELASNAVTTVKITDANVTAAKLATDSVTTIKIADANVTTAKIADANVTDTKIGTNAVKRASAHFGDFGKYLCSVTKSSNQAVTSGSGFVAITWDTELVDREGMHSTSSLTARVQIPAAGLYAIAWDVFASGAAGTIRVRRDGTTQITDDYPVADGVVDSRIVVRNLPSGYIELMYDAIGATGTLSGPSCGLTVLSLDL